MAGADSQGPARLYRALRNTLRLDPDGEQIIAAFEANPAGSSKALAARLDAMLRNDPQLTSQLLAAMGEDADARFVNMIIGGHVDQIVNVARLGVLNLTVKRYLYIFKDVTQLVVFLGVVALAIIAIAYAVWRVQQPRVMTGDFNIAVASFGEVDSDGRWRTSGDSTKVSRALANYLDSEYTSSDFGVDVQVSHDRMPLIEEGIQADRLAENINADLVIYGSLLGDGRSAHLLPRFWVRPSPDLAEISGQNSLEAPIFYEPAKLAETGYLTETLRNNAAILVLFTKALVSYRANNLDASAQALNQAVAEAKTDFPGKEILYLLGSTIALNQRDYKLALQRADMALALNPEYARGYLALGNVYYGAFSDAGTEEGPWERENLLDEAQQLYLHAQQVNNVSPVAYLGEKIDVSLGNVLVIKAQLRNDSPALFQQAVGYLSPVVSRYEASQDLSYRAANRHVAALAYQGLGAVSERQGNFTQAAHYYRLCLEATTVPTTRDQCTKRLAIVAPAP